MTELYFITRLDAVNDILIFALIFLTTALILVPVAYFLNMDDYYYYKEERKEKCNMAMKYGKRVLVLLIVLSVAVVLIPTTKQAYVIYGIGGTIDYCKRDSTIQAMPKKVIEACDAYLDEMLNEKEDKQQ